MSLVLIVNETEEENSLEMFKFDKFFLFPTHKKSGTVLDTHSTH